MYLLKVSFKLLDELLRKTNIHLYVENLPQLFHKNNLIFIESRNQFFELINANKDNEVDYYAKLENNTLFKEALDQFLFKNTILRIH